MADAADSKSAGATREGSNPSPGTRSNQKPAYLHRFVDFSLRVEANAVAAR